MRTGHWSVVTAATAARRIAGSAGASMVSAGFYLIVVSVLSALWRAAAQANGGAVAGYSAVALTWYVATSEAATVSLNVKMIEEVADDISGGSIAVELLRPAPVLWVRVAAEVGRALPRLLGCAVAGIGLALVTVGAPPSMAALVLAAPALVLAITCNLVAQHAFAAAAFWTRDARSAWFLYQKLVFILGGMLLPLQVLPAPIAAVALRLPMMAMAYAPARLASGHFEPTLLLVQLGWLAVLGALATAVFARGEHRLQVVGG